GEGASEVPTDRTNLVWKAAVRLAHMVGRAPLVEIVIDKGIPVAGGMAGGSADAAATLVGLNELWDLGLSREELTAVAAELGSDVPFSLHGGTALGTGRGERLLPVLSRNTFHWVIALAKGDCPLRPSTTSWTGCARSAIRRASAHRRNSCRPWLPAIRNI